MWPQFPVVAGTLPSGRHPVKVPGYDTCTGRYRKVAANMEPSKLPGHQVDRGKMEGIGLRGGKYLGGDEVVFVSVS